MEQIKKDNYIITCQSGLEDILAQEIKNLGIEIEKIGHNFVSCFADNENLYKMNMCLRTALHILKKLKTIKVNSYDLLYFQAKKINWHKMFNVDKTIRIDVNGTSHILNHSQFAVHRIKDAVLDTFRKFNDSTRPSIDKNNPQIQITAYLNGNEVTLYLDSSGVPLFKRGYRKEHATAPIKEDLAAGLLLLSDWDKKNNVLDPMCGSGTFLIEAYMIANNIPPNLNRTFAFMNWLDYNKKLYDKVKKELFSQIKDTETKFLGYEINKETFRIAKEILSGINHLNKINIQNIDFKDSKESFNNWFIISNPPYGERLDEEKNLIDLYKSIGDFLKQKCINSSSSIFTGNLNLIKSIGLRSKSRLKVFNGSIESRLLKFDIYKGSNS